VNHMDDCKERNGNNGVYPNAYLEDGIRLEKICNPRQQFPAEIAPQGEPEHKDSHDRGDSIGRVAEYQG
jgi:hypothetical protein